MPDDVSLKRPLTPAEIIARYDGRAPRYTSYPTALQFTAAVDERAYRQWLSTLPAEARVSLYVHIPFCDRLCLYCGCNTRVVRRRETIGEYLALLLNEARLLAAAAPAGLTVSSIHLGGGTPNMVSPEQLDLLMAGLKATFRFTEDYEVAAELDPAILTEDWVKAAAAHGLRRASLGVQTLDPKVQEAVTRRESRDDIARCVRWLREAGVGSINIDLMYGLPFQTVPAVLSTVDAILAMRPERVALFGYAHVPWMKPHQKLLPEAELPGPSERLDQSEAAAERLTGAGYLRVGIDHFALPEDDLAWASVSGRLRRNFQGYTADQARTVLGLGASSIGSLPEGYVQNAAQEVQWRNAVRAGRMPIVRGVALTEEDRFRADIIERVMCDLQVDLAAACRRHGRTLADLAPAIAALDAFRRDGLAQFDGRTLRVMDMGRPVVRAIAAKFDAYLEPSGGHSRTI